jgi:hypothetical protein
MPMLFDEAVQEGQFVPDCHVQMTDGFVEFRGSHGRLLQTYDGRVQLSCTWQYDAAGSPFKKILKSAPAVP